ncbi:MAG: sigma-54-dependent transcriptional regulator [Kiritimatiellia bacterium]
MDTERKPRILIVDDDRNTRDGLQRALRRGYDVMLAESGDRALQILHATDIDILVSDVRMPGMDGVTLLQRARAHHPELVSILLTAYGNVEVAVEAMKAGAYDFLMKPVNLDHLDLLLQRALRSRDVESENRKLREELDNKYGLESIIGASPVMQDLFAIIRQAAPSQATVLIQGESGTGKELVAHAVHRLSTRSKGPFVAVHCAALSDSLLESELFGHEKGAFTGAVARRKGRFESADGGTLFLDEISEIDPSVQVKLLRVLEERCFERVGGSEVVDVDIRLVAATNRDLRAWVDEGRFREDLFFRLDVVTITMPPLRDRLDDLPLLCSHFITEFAGRNGKSIAGISSEAIELLAGYRWPGNIRELRNTIEKMVVLSRADRLGVRDIPANIRQAVRGADGSSGAVRSVRAVAGAPGVGQLADTEKAMILEALEQHGGNRTKAAEVLGISRRTLHRKLRQYAGAQGASMNGDADVEGATDANI